MLLALTNHELTGLPIVTASMVLQTNPGPIVGIFHEYAHLGKWSSIHASGQLEWFHTHIDEHSKIVGRQQHLVTLTGYTIPISINSGLAYIRPVSIHLIMTFRRSHMWSLPLHKNGTQLSLMMGLTWNYFQTLPFLLINAAFLCSQSLSLSLFLIMTMGSTH